MNRKKPVFTNLEDDQREDSEYLAKHMRRFYERSISNHFNIGGQEFYQNKQGRCEDAPCCGCCNC